MFATYFISGSISSWRPGLQMNESHLWQFWTNGWVRSEIEAMLEISRDCTLLVWFGIMSIIMRKRWITCQKTRGHKEEHQVLMVLNEKIRQFSILIFFSVAIYCEKKCPIFVNVSTIPESVYSRVTSGQALWTWWGKWFSFWMQLKINHQKKQTPGNFGDHKQKIDEIALKNDFLWSLVLSFKSLIVWLNTQGKVKNSYLISNWQTTVMIQNYFVSCLIVDFSWLDKVLVTVQLLWRCVRLDCCVDCGNTR